MKKIKIGYISFSLFFVVFLLATSCKDTDINNANPLKLNSVQTNQLNPYEDFGIIHNELLDQFITYRENLSSSCEYSDFIDNFNNAMVSSACIVFSDNSNQFKNDVSGILQFYQDSISMMTLQELLDDYDNTEFSTEVNTFIAFVNGPLDIASLQDEIIDWENNVLENQNLNQEQKKVLLIAGSIARYSSYYWYEISNDQNSDWYYQFDCTTKSKIENSTLRIEKIVMASVSAALKYGIYGLITGNPVTLVAAGATSASVDAAKAVELYWEDIVDAVSSAVNWLIGWF